MTPTTRQPERTRVVRSQVEPRLAERRRQVADDDRVRRRRTGLIVLVVLLVVAAIAGTLFSPLFDVDRVEVHGVRGLATDELVAATGVQVGDSMVEVDVAGARDALRRLPGVRSASVSREWPSTVRVEITEEQPVAALVVGEERRAISATGRILEVGPDVLGPLLPFSIEDPDLLRPEGAAPGAEVHEAIRAAALALHRIAPEARSQIASVRVAEGSLSVLLGDGAVVLFGPVEDLPAKVAATEAVLSQVAPECRETVDVRQPSRVTVSRVAGCEGPAVTQSTVPEVPGEG